MTDQQPLKPMTPADWSALEKKLIAEHEERTLQMNQEIRQKALTGKWLPKQDESFYDIYGRRHTAGLDYADIGDHYFPDEQTRTEFLDSRKGKWLPKKGDTFFTLLPNGGFVNDKVAQCDFVPDPEEWIYFPSAEQRSAFIAKRKGEEPKVLASDGGNATGERTRRLTPPELLKNENYESEMPLSIKERVASKPQTITICISDEAMKKVLRTVQFLMPDVTEAYARSIMEATISGLHLENTLQNQA